MSDRELIEATTHVVYAAKGVVREWYGNRGWDCSARPGHEDVEQAINRLANALDEAEKSIGEAELGGTKKG